MKVGNSATLVAIVGGSGSGKSWLADRLRLDLGGSALSLSLDDFYRDLSALTPERRESINFDRPSAIEWSLFKKTLTACATGKPIRLPQYDFKHHCRLATEKLSEPRPVVIIDGLWLLHHSSVRRMFHVTVYLACPEKLRMHRRIHRDVIERGRTLRGSWEGFHTTVKAMHDQYVAPQEMQAQHVLECPLDEPAITRLQEGIRAASATGASVHSPAFQEKL